MDLAKVTVEALRYLLPALGELVDEAPDTMVLHTREAYRLFVGRSLDAGSPRAAIVGGRRVAAALRAIWHLSGNDNLYADWVLDNIGERLGEIGSSCSGKRSAARTSCAPCSSVDSTSRCCSRACRNGWNSASAVPTAMPSRIWSCASTPAIGCSRPLVRKDLLPDRDGRTLIYSYTRRLRGLFEELVRFERWLMRDELRPLSRHDFLPAADAEASKRVQAVLALFGPVPRDVFTGTRAPRHSQRRVEFTAQELRLLQDADLSGSPAAGDGDEATLL